MAIFSEQSSLASQERGYTPDAAEQTMPSVETEAPAAEKSEAEQAAELDTQATGKLADFDSDQKASIESTIQTGQDMGFSPAEIDRKMESLGTRSALDDLQAKAHQAYSGFKKLLTVGFGAAVMTQGAEMPPPNNFYDDLAPGSAHEQVLTGKQANKTETVSSNVAIDSSEIQANTLAAQAEKKPRVEAQRKSETEKKEKSSVTTAEQIKKDLLTDIPERAYLSSSQTGENYQLLGTGSHRDIKINMDAIVESVPEGAKDVTLTHTHPLTIAQMMGHTPEDLEKMRAGQMEMPLLPPSSPDMFMQGQVNYTLQKKSPGLKVKSQVLEPSGSWQFEVDPNNPQTKIFGEAYKEVDKMTQEFNTSLTAKERKLLSERGYNKIEPGANFTGLLEDKKTRAIAEKYLGNIKSYQSGNVDYQKAVQSVVDTELVASEMRMSSKKGYSADTRQHLIDMYTGYCKQNGIDMSYTPAVKNVSEGKTVPVPVEIAK